jgi:hypothetical protein
MLGVLRAAGKGRTGKGEGSSENNFCALKTLKHPHLCVCSVDFTISTCGSDLR